MKRLLSILVIATVLTCAAQALGQQLWNQQKGNCEAVFANFEKAELAELKYCMGLWEAYRDVASLKEQERAASAKVFQRLYVEGDPETQHIARGALARLGFTPQATADGPKKPEVEEKKARKRYRPHSVSKDAAAASMKTRNKAMALYEKKNYRGATEVLDQALQLDPGNVQALYDMACCYGLLGDKANAVEYLLRLGDIGSKESLVKLKKARTDKDFAEFRDDPEYKRATGYCRIKVVNGMPSDDEEIGDDNVFKIVEVLNGPKLAYKAEEGGKDKHSRDRPHVWFKAHSKNQAYVIARLVGHPKIRLVPIDWETDFDIIVSWADKVEVNKDGEKVVKYSLTKKAGGSGPGLDPEKQADFALNEQNKALREPDEYARKAEHVIDTPERMGNKVDSAKDRVDSSIKTMEKVGDKAGKLLPQ
jgi:tetratricopeptide (TPR) repeat protein